MRPKRNHITAIMEKCRYVGLPIPLHLKIEECQAHACRHLLSWLLEHDFNPGLSTRRTNRTHKEEVGDPSKHARPISMV